MWYLSQVLDIWNQGTMWHSFRRYQLSSYLTSTINTIMSLDNSLLLSWEAFLTSIMTVFNQFLALPALTHTYSFSNSCTKYLLSTCCISSTILGTRGIKMYKKEFLLLKRYSRMKLTAFEIKPQCDNRGTPKLQGWDKVTRPEFQSPMEI